MYLGPHNDRPVS